MQQSHIQHNLHGSRVRINPILQVFSRICIHVFILYSESRIGNEALEFWRMEVRVEDLSGSRGICSTICMVYCNLLYIYIYIF